MLWSPTCLPSIRQEVMIYSDTLAIMADVGSSSRPNRPTGKLYGQDSIIGKIHAGKPGTAQRNKSYKYNRGGGRGISGGRGRGRTRRDSDRARSGGIAGTASMKRYQHHLGNYRDEQMVRLGNFPSAAKITYLFNSQIS